MAQLKEDKLDHSEFMNFIKQNSSYKRSTPVLPVKRFRREVEPLSPPSRTMLTTHHVSPSSSRTATTRRTPAITMDK